MNKKLALLLIVGISLMGKTSFGQLIPETNGFLWGMNGHPLGQPMYQDVSLNEQFAMLHQLNVRGYRIDVSLVPNTLTVTQKRIDSILDLCKKYNIILLPMVYTSNIISYNKDTAYNESLGEKYAKLFCQYFPTCKYVEIGNENETHYKTVPYNVKSDKLITGTTDYNRLSAEAAYMRGFINKIHILKPNIKTLVNFAFGNSWYLKALSKLNVNFDIIANHFYTNLNWTDKSANSGPNHGSFINMLVDVYKYFNGTKNIWITEYNHPGGSTNAKVIDQHNTIASAIKNVGTYSYIKALFFYELIDESLLKTSVVAERHYGFTLYDESTHSLEIKPFFKR